MTLSPEFNPMRTRSRSNNTDPDTNETFNPDQLQPRPDDSLALNDEALNDHPDRKDVGDLQTASSPPSSISQKVKNDSTLKTDEVDLNVFDYETAPPRKRGRPRKRKLGNNINGTLSNDKSTLKNTQRGSKASAEKSTITVSKAEDHKEKEEPVDNKDAAQVIENQDTKDNTAEEPVKRRGRKRKTTPTKKPPPRAPRNNADADADADTKLSTPIKWTLPHLLHSKESMLTAAVNLKNNVTMDLINKLPEKDRDELLKLLPPADIDFVKRNDDGDASSIIVAKSLDEHEQLSNQPETYKPVISQRLVSPSFTQAIEDFQVNLQHGCYDNNPKPATGRGRKRKEVVEEQHDDFKDEHFEAYWGERLKKRSKKGGGRR